MVSPREKEHLPSETTNVKFHCNYKKNSRNFFLLFSTLCALFLPLPDTK